MVYDGIWNLAQFESDLGDDLGVSVMPKLDNGNVPALFAQGEGFYLNANADDAKTAAFIEWGKFVTSEEGQTIAATQGGLLPVNPNVMVDDPNLQVFADQFALGTPFPNRAGTRCVLDADGRRDHGRQRWRRDAGSGARRRLTT